MKKKFLSLVIMFVIMLTDVISFPEFANTINAENDTAFTYDTEDFVSSAGAIHSINTENVVSVEKNDIDNVYSAQKEDDEIIEEPDDIIEEVIENDEPINEVIETPIEEENVKEEVKLEKIFPTENLSAEIQHMMKEVCDKWNIPMEILMAIAYNESRYNVNAVGPDGKDRGICQIRITNYDWLCDKIGRKLDLFNPYDNFEASCFILDDIRNRKPSASWEYILLSYNRGPSGAKKYVQKYGTSSNDYTKKILKKAYSLGFK